VVLEQLWGPGLYLLFVVILLFPDGRLVSRFWRWVLGAYCTLYAAQLVALAVAAAGVMIGHPIRVDATGGLAAIDRPAGWYRIALHGMDIALLVLSVGFIGRQALSWRRSSGERRQQLKWLASGAAVTVASVVIAVPLSSAGAPATLLQWVGGLAWFGVAALPVSIGIGILKYRLYEIDRIISRTLAYAIVTGLLVGVYAGLVPRPCS
jgi:two-component system, NarL family, sensor kinase